MVHDARCMTGRNHRLFHNALTGVLATMARRAFRPWGPGKRTVSWRPALAQPSAAGEMGASPLALIGLATPVLLLSTRHTISSSSGVGMQQPGKQAETLADSSSERKH